jgi:hypothetical protein
MKAMLLTGHGGPEMLRYGDAPDPTPALSISVGQCNLALYGSFLTFGAADWRRVATGAHGAELMPPDHCKHRSAPTAISRDQFRAVARLAIRRAQHQPSRYARRTPQNSGNAAFTMSVISDRNAVGWNSCPSGMHGKVSSARI